MCLVPGVRADCLDGVAAAGVVGCGCDLLSAPEETRLDTSSGKTIHYTRGGSNRFHNKGFGARTIQNVPTVEKIQNY